jgi:hypothetical protein
MSGNGNRLALDAGQNASIADFFNSIQTFQPFAGSASTGANGPMRSCLNRPYAAAQLSHCWRSCAAQHSDLWVVGSADFPGIGQNSVLVVR